MATEDDRGAGGRASVLVDRLRAAGCVFAEEEAEELLATGLGGEDLEALVRRRVEGEPLEHVVGRVRFGGLVLRVDPGVFVPRQRTAALAAAAVRAAREAGREARPVVVELCCGAGAVAAVVRRDVPEAQVYAADVDPAAVACARRNLPGAEGVLEGDLYDALPQTLRGRLDVLVANAPYVPTAELRLLPREARDHEPVRAVDGGADGLALHRRLLADARSWLAPAGALLTEVGADQVTTLLGLVEEVGMVGEAVRGRHRETFVRATPSSRLGAISYQV